MKTLTVEKAIKRGYILINVLVIVLFLIGLIGSIFLFVKFKYFSILLLGIPLNFIAMWLLWSYIVTEWKIWAYSNCRNVHELKRKAINYQLIGPEGSKSERFEFRTERQKRLLLQVEENIKLADVETKVHDDGTLPNELVIQYSKMSNAILWASIIITLGLGIYSIYAKEIYGFILVPASIFLMSHSYKNPKTKEPHIILNDKGIKLVGNSFVSWSKLTGEEIKLIGSGESARWHLHIKMKNNNYQEIEINDLTESPKKIEKLVKIYKQRNKKYR